MTQRGRVKERLDRGLPITSLDAFHKLGIVHLPSAIRDLKKEGYPIESKFIPVKNRFGERCSVKVYRKKVEVKTAESFDEVFV